MSATRGERNNNPGNIVRDTTPWLGLVPFAERKDERFCEFDTALHGIRALCKVLLSYQRLDGCRTLAQMIHRWAPPGENDTDAYIADVAAQSGIAAEGPIDVEHPGDLFALARAIISHENGRCIYGGDVIDAAVRMAIGG